MSSIPTSSPRPFIPAPGVMQAEMVYHYLGQTVENIYHVRQGDGSAPPTIAQMQALAGVLELWEHEQGFGMRNTAATLDHIVVRDLSSASGPAIIRLPTSTVTGVGGGVPPPGNVTVAVKWNTALRGRSFRGRTYHIGLPASYITGNQLTTAGQSDLVTRYTELITRLDSFGGTTPVVLSYAHNKFWRSTALATEIINPTVDLNLDSQRRRLASRGQ